jgi:hypothetical protein
MVSSTKNLLYSRNNALFYTRDGIAYGAARNFTRSSPKSARSRMISELHAGGIKGAAAKEGEFISTLIGDAWSQCGHLNGF